MEGGEKGFRMLEISTAYILHTLPEGGCMGYTKKTLQELNLIDNFLSNAIATNQEINEPFYRLLLSVLLGKKLKKIRVLSQQVVPPVTPDLRGIRMDVEITEYDEETVTNVYDLEPHIKDSLQLPRHNRYYQAKIDGRYVKSGLRDFSAIPNLYIITITNYDLFGEDYMMYTIHNKCDEVPKLDYDDGLKFVYFNTKGQKGGSQAIKNMLTYFQNSDSKNVVDDATRIMDSYVSRVKNLPEVEAGYMTLGDWADDLEEEIREGVREEVKETVKEEIREEVKAEVKEEVKAEVKEEVKAEVKEEIKAEVKEEIKAEIQNAMNLEYIKILIETVHEYRGTKENAAAKIREKFPEYTNQAEELVEKYWMES
ncbi:MAG: hypothetical protein NC416_06525 [Eubacterium sp.]|nr:hypothetical protein [Eubacterium sp.]